MAVLRVVFDTNVFSPESFDALDASPIRDLIRRRKVALVCSIPFFEEMARAYISDRLRPELLNRWFPFIVETAGRFCEDHPTIWQRELVSGAGQKVSIHVKPRVQAAMIAEMLNLPPDGSWPLIHATVAERAQEASRLEAQRTLSKEMRKDVTADTRDIRRAGRKVGAVSDSRDGLVGLIGTGMIERHLGCWDWRAVVNRWNRDRAQYRYFTQFVANIVHKEILFLEDQTVGIDRNAQPDLDLMTFLLDADAFVTNEKGFARRAFNDIWKPRGKLIFTSSEFVRLLQSMAP